MSRADSIRQTASMARCVSEAVTASNHTGFSHRGKLGGLGPGALS